LNIVPVMPEIICDAPFTIRAPAMNTYSTDKPYNGNNTARIDKPSVIAPATINKTLAQPDIRVSDIPVAIPPASMKSSAVKAKGLLKVPQLLEKQRQQRTILLQLHLHLC
jgi:hypothetical protein